MSDIDTAAIRAAWGDPQADIIPLVDAIPALCDALDDARAERDAMTHDAFFQRGLNDRQAKTIGRLQVIAEAAEARVAELERRIHPGQGEGYANEVERQRAVIEQLRHVALGQKARITAALAIHVKNSSGYCTACTEEGNEDYCGITWPCPTARALTGDTP